jgi:hypothetical protein
MSKSSPSLYYMLFSSIMAIYRDTFKETRDFPVAYASAIVTVIFGFIWIAFSYLLIRTEIWPDAWINFPIFVFHNRIGAFVVLIIFYLCHCIYFLRKEKWKSILVEFDELSANQRRFTYACLIVLSTF